MQFVPNGRAHEHRTVHSVAPFCQRCCHYRKYSHVRTTTQ